MKRWSRRLIYLLIFLIWLSIVSLPLGAVFLAMEREIQLGDDPRNQLRLFLIQEDEAEGVAVQWTRPDGRCAETKVLFLLWKGDGENVTYCQCYDPDGALAESDSGGCPVP